MNLIASYLRKTKLVPRLSLLCLPSSLFAAGHVITQHPGGKKICWVGGVAVYFDCCSGKIPRAVAKIKLPTLSGFDVTGSLPMKECYTLFLPSSKYRRLSFTKLSRVVYFLLCAVFWMLKSISVKRSISRVF